MTSWSPSGFHDVLIIEASLPRPNWSFFLMPSITFVNMDGDSKSFDLEETSNQEALLGGFDHLDKPIKERREEEKTNGL